MERAPFGHRQQERQQQQQQPQQSAFYAVQYGDAGKQAKPETSRKAWQQLAMAQAQQQSGGEL